MAVKIHQHLFLFTFLSLFFTIHANLHLHPSDLTTLTTLQTYLGVNVNANSVTNQPCNADGVFCERRLSSNETYVLRITKLIFNSKQLKGKLSPIIGRFTELKELSLSHNKIVDGIPTSIVDCRKLEILNLSNNLFSGEVPSEFSSFIRLRILDISSNNLSGNLNFLRYFPNLETLSIANNLFTGRIPSSVRSFRNLRHFNFSGNRFLESSVSLNQRLLEFENTDITLNLNPKRYILAENHSPASAPSPHHKKSGSGSGSASAPGPSASVHGHKHKKSKRKLIGWIVGFIAGAFAGIISGFIFSVLFKLTLALIKGKGKGSSPAIYSPLIKKAEDLAFLEKEDGLASMEIIGRGGCGEVYRAELPGSDGKMIAIKKIIQPSRDAMELAEEHSKLLHKKMRQIKSEINTVGQIRHRNLLPLLAHLSRPDCHYLVYEFMKNGSLQDMLNRVEKGEIELDWLSRHKIALGIAAGLEYLHMSHSPRIIHRDLKPANILLDDDMEARIADFGLAKAMPEAQTHITTSKVAGTVGYIAPEYHQILKFTDKCDIYSFGVILGVLVTGKLPSDGFFQHTEEMSLVKWMKNVMTSENPKIAIDSRLMGNGYEEQMLLVLKIACFCTMDDPKERPNSKDVRCMLSQIKH